MSSNRMSPRWLTKGRQLPLRRQQTLISNGELRDVSELAPRVPRAVATVVRRALREGPEAAIEKPGRVAPSSGASNPATN